MKSLIQHKQFVRDYRLQKRRGKKIVKLEETIQILTKKRILPVKYRPHKLSGEWNGFWECHIESDWLLIYTVTDMEVFLIRTGTHADLFE